MSNHGLIFPSCSPQCHRISALRWLVPAQKLLQAVPAQDKQLVEITSSPESVRQGGCELSSTYARINCERSRSRGHLRELCRAGLRLGDEHRESDALVPHRRTIYAHEDGALLSTFDSFASSLRSVTAALEDQRKLTDLQESQLAEARDQATTQSAQLLERQPLLPFICSQLKTCFP